MLNHKLTGDQLEYQKLARDFAERELAPNAHKFDSSAEFPREILSRAFESGLLNTQVPEALGGLGLSTYDGAIIAEELGAGDCGIAGSAEASTFAQQFLIDFGSKEQHDEYLTPLLDQPALAGYAAGGGIKSSRVFFRREGDEYILSGRHGAIINGGVAQWYLVRAQEDRRETEGRSKGGSSADKESFSYFIVKADDDGLVFGERSALLGRRCMVATSARFEEILLPATSLLGTIGQGLEIHTRCLTKTYPLAAAGMVGVARASLEHAIKYAKERTTFGVNIGNHQAIAFMLADMAKDVEAARLLVYQAAQLADQGHVSTTEAVCAKAFAQDMVMRTTCDAVQIFGGYGFSREYPVEKLMRDAKVYQLFENTSESTKVELGRELVMSV
ncbi:MAG: acyl-CoA dehydrogenase family protein [Cyanobacteria bacterium SZAS LIN-2]|nr:acyl-CoA dehydrogenase family protein [Cyanobacteria bacterium SZAS LIN-3]MBS1998576.1 acyl-CoA dehydrogenase family protein [Cyanobacteria bacterium SZAS LIN-2]